MRNETNETPPVTPPEIDPDIDARPRKRHAFITGFIAIFPLVLTLFVIGIIWQIIDKVSGPLGALITFVVVRTTTFKEIPQWAGTVAALILTLVAIYVMGLAILNIFGARLVNWTDRVFSRLPLLRYIYPHAKQLSDFLFGTRKLNFSRVVVAEYPRKGIYALGFVTSGGIPAVSRKLNQNVLAVFIPTSPTPFTGWTVLMPESEVTPIDMTVDEAVRFVVSCGVITPEQVEQLTTTRKAAAEGAVLPPAAAPADREG